MVLKASASWPNSSRASTGTTWSRLPAPMAWAERVTAWIGRRMARLLYQARTTRQHHGGAQAEAEVHQRVGRRVPGVAGGVLHVLLIEQ